MLRTGNSATPSSHTSAFPASGSAALRHSAARAYRSRTCTGHGSTPWSTPRKGFPWPAQHEGDLEILLNKNPAAARRPARPARAHARAGAARADCCTAHTCILALHHLLLLTNTRRARALAINLPCACWKAMTAVAACHLSAPQVRLGYPPSPVQLIERLKSYGTAVSQLYLSTARPVGIIYGRVHRSVKKICRAAPRAPRMLCTRPRLGHRLLERGNTVSTVTNRHFLKKRSIPKRDLLEGIP